MTLSSSSAETVALRVLGWLAGNEELLPIFLGSTGASAEDLKAQAGDPIFLGAVLDFIMMDDAWVMQAGDALGLDYTQIGAIRAALPGGEQVNWT